MRAMNPSVAWRWWLVACVAFRTTIPLMALAFEGRALPGLPAYTYGPLYGDANGYYAGAREAVSAAGRAAPAVLVALVITVVVVVAGRRRRVPSWALVLIAGAGTAAVATIVVAAMKQSGATVIGWPLVWAVPLAPLRVFGAAGPDGAFVPGIILSLVANAVTGVAVAYVGLRATGRRSVGAIAAGLYAIWPFIPGIVVGAGANANGMWNVEVGLHLYTEPLSTALVVSAVALVLREPPTDLSLTLAGLALGYATAVKLTDAAIGACLFAVILLYRGPRAAAILGAGGLVFLPLVAAHWSKGYARYFNGGVSVNPHPFGLHYVAGAWTDSIMFTPAMLTLLVVPAIVGFATVSNGFVRAVLGLPIAATVVLYSFYDVTPLHPRFFFVVLPLVLALDAAGVVWIGSKLTRRTRAASRRVSSMP